MLKKVLIGLAVPLLLLVVVIATRPSDFKVERSTVIAAPPDTVFTHVNDFHAWGAWSPWEKLDPDMQKSYEGAPSGPGAVYSWSGNDKVGKGRMTIERSERPSLVGLKLEFFAPWQAVNTTTFALSPSAEGTKVTWAMAGKNNFGAKAASLFMNMDALVGKDFEQGLAALKAISEASKK